MRDDQSFRRGLENAAMDEVLNRPIVDPSNEGPHYTADSSGSILSPLLTDLGNAHRLILFGGQDLRYSASHKSWFVWDGKRWAYDACDSARKRVQDVMLRFYKEAVVSGDEYYQKFARQSLESRRLSAALREAQPHLSVSGELFDRDPWLLNFQNGTLDLRTFDLRPHAQQDMLTKILKYNYSPSARCPTFLRFLDRIMGANNAEAETPERTERLAQYLQRVFGYSLTGVTGEKAFFVFHGSGNNGKSTLLSTFRELLDEYAVLIQIDSLMSRQESNNNQADLADLKGARFVMTSETEEGQRLSEGRLKRITQGMGRIKAVRKYENPIEFDETHKIFMDANHRPVIRGTDPAIWNRLHMVPFEVTIPKEEIDKALPKKLQAEGEGILAWAVEGCRQWRANGLQRPDEVNAAGEDWKEEMDQVGRFIEDRCITASSGYVSVRARELHSAYTKWCEDAGENPMSATALGVKMANRGYKKVDKRTGIYYEHIGLREIERSDEDEK